MPIGKHRDKAAEDARTIARVTGLLEGYAATGANQVSIKHVLDYLDPRGLWSYDPEREKTAQKPLELPPGIDPMTGCRPATAPSSNSQSGLELAGSLAPDSAAPRPTGEEAGALRV